MKKKLLSGVSQNRMYLLQEWDQKKMHRLPYTA